MFPVKHRRGLEVGGPSPVFTATGELPLYHNATHLDCVCYSRSTVWNVALNRYAPGDKTLGKFIEAEASDLLLDSQSYDYILSSHQLEHSANPIQVLKEFHRVLVPHGNLLVIVPDKMYTFDRRRPFTELSHLMNDYIDGKTERDLTHFGEIMHLHDLAMDSGAPQSVEGFAMRSLQNYKNRCLHHHVFNEHVMKSILEFAGFSQISFEAIGIHLIFTAGK